MSQLRVGSIATIAGTTALSLNNGIVTDLNKPAFNAFRNSTHTASGIAPFDITSVNVGGHYNTSNYRFTAPIAGNYLFSAYLLPNTQTGFFFEFYKNGARVNSLQSGAYAVNADETVSISTIMALVPNDYVQVYVNLNGFEGTWSSWCGFLLG
jgi:hypothetical protein